MVQSKKSIENGKYPDLLYITPKSNTVRSKSLKLFTDLYSHFYIGSYKQIPTELLSQCTLPHFLAILYMDDGSLCISTRVNDRLKKIYVSPHIYLYLQCYSEEELFTLQQYIVNTFQITFSVSKRKDGKGSILKTTRVEETMKFLETIKSVVYSCPSMYYKTNWEFRRKVNLPDYEFITTSSSRSKKYSYNELKKLVSLKNEGYTDIEISKILNRSYWSIVYKLSSLRKEGLL